MLEKGGVAVLRSEFQAEACLEGDEDDDDGRSAEMAEGDDFYPFRPILQSYLLSLLSGVLVIGLGGSILGALLTFWLGGAFLMCFFTLLHWLRSGQGR